ncbi:MAG: ATPase inhibitor subunit zeta [Cucumibacter sp.]
MAADFVEAGDADVVRKLRADLDAKGIAVTDAEIRKQLDLQLVVAAEQIASKG